MERAKRKYDKRDEALTVMTHRKCRICGDNLTSGRYFNCVTCIEELPSDDGDLTYFSELVEDEDNCE